MISYKQGIAIFLMYIMGSTIITLGNLGYHSWQAMIVAFIWALPLAYLYDKILKKYPNKNLYEIIGENMNKYISKILMLILLIFSLYISGRILYNYTDFVYNSSLIGKKRTILIILILVLLIYMLKSKLKTCGRLFYMLFMIAIVTTILLFILTFNAVNYNNLLPIIPYHLGDFGKNILIFVVQPFAESILLINVLAKVTNKPEKKNKIFLKGMFLTFLVMMFYLIRIVGVLGDHFVLYTVYPLYSYVSALEILGFLTRVESITVIVFFFAAIVKLFVTSYSVLLGIKSLFKLDDEKKMIIPSVIIIGVLSTILYQNLDELRSFTQMYCIIASVCYFIIPLFLAFKKKKVLEETKT